MRRYILGPVIACLVVIGLVGSDFGLLTQAQAGNGIKKEAATVASKDVKKKEQIKKAPQAVDSKKVASVKKKAKNRHASADGRKSIKKKSGKPKMTLTICPMICVGGTTWEAIARASKYIVALRSSPRSAICSRTR